MGGWMDYARFRNRNGIGFRKPLSDPDPYPRSENVGMDSRNAHLLIGDLNRMERDYLQPVYPGEGQAQREEGSDPASQVAKACDLDVETVRKVLRCVFWGDHHNVLGKYREWDGES